MKTGSLLKDQDEPKGSIERGVMEKAAQKREVRVISKTD